MTWGALASTAKTYSAVTSGTPESWTATISTAKTYSAITGGPNESWTGLASYTTNHNTSRFVLYSASKDADKYVNPIPAYRSIGEAGRGAGFVWESDSPIRFWASGESF